MILLLSAAYADPGEYRPPDLAVTSVGADVVSAQSIDAQDANFMLGQRVRWTVAGSWRVLLDGRFIIDPAAEVTFEDSRLRELGLTGDTGPVSWWFGRQAVQRGGPRLVDGVQGLAHVRGDLALGAWAGLVPDEFTTAPTTRYGGGPIVAFDRGVASLSAMGDFVGSSEGLQRLGALLQARGEIGSRLQADGRLDWLFDDALGNSGLADGSVFLQYRPTHRIRLDGFYDGFSSLRYQTRSSLDPNVQRFATRIEALGLEAGITQDEVDASVHHLVGGTFRATTDGDLRAVLNVRARTLFHPDPTERYDRAGVLVGAAGLLGDQLELDLDANALSLETGLSGDAGVLATFTPDGLDAMAVDASVRALFDPAFAGAPGWYADLFVDLVLASGTSVSAGASWTDEPSDLLGQDVGIGGFLQIRQWFRPGRRTPSASDAETP